MNLPENQSTKKYIKKDTYSNIRDRFKQYATYWNSIWNIWKGTNPTWGQDARGNYLNQTIPVQYRYTNKVTYSQKDGEINPTLPALESEIIETLGNQNIIREKVKEFNNTIASKFSEIEYSSVGGELYKKPIMSYGVNYIFVNNNGAEEPTKLHLYTKDFEKFSYVYRYGKKENGNYVYRDEKGEEVEYSTLPKVTLYTDVNLTDSYGTIPISLIKEDGHYYVEWTGERFYVKRNIDQFDRVSGESYTAPNNLTSNNSRGITVSNDTLGGNIYKIFNGNTNLNFKRGVSSGNPEIIYFNLAKSLRITSYTIQAETEYNSYPTAWRLEGSSDKSKWNVVYTTSGQQFSKGQSKSFTVSDQNYYLYWRLVITGFHEVSYKVRKHFFSRTAYSNSVRKFTFTGQTSYVSLNSGRVQPAKLGKTYSSETPEEDFRKIKTYTTAMTNPKDYQHFSEFNYDVVEGPYYNSEKPETYYKNLTELKIYDRDNKMTLNNTDNGIRQDNIVRKEDLDQIQRVLDKINAVLKLRDGWFDSNGRCNLSCQVQCQHGCQVSCQSCNTHQCHNQKCGTH
jgi:hypothetical protein